MSFRNASLDILEASLCSPHPQVVAWILRERSRCFPEDIDEAAFNHKCCIWKTAAFFSFNWLQRSLVACGPSRDIVSLYSPNSVSSLSVEDELAGFSAQSAHRIWRDFTGYGAHRKHCFLFPFINISIWILKQIIFFSSLNWTLMFTGG